MKRKILEFLRNNRMKILVIFMIASLLLCYLNTNNTQIIRDYEDPQNPHIGTRTAFNYIASHGLTHGPHVRSPNYVKLAATTTATLSLGALIIPCCVNGPRNNNDQENRPIEDNKEEQGILSNQTFIEENNRLNRSNEEENNRNMPEQPQINNQNITTQVINEEQMIREDNKYVNEEENLIKPLIRNQNPLSFFQNSISVGSGSIVDIPEQVLIPVDIGSGSMGLQISEDQNPPIKEESTLKLDENQEIKEEVNKSEKIVIKKKLIKKKLLKKKLINLKKKVKK